jgi:hypothetical protein
LAGAGQRSEPANVQGVCCVNPQLEMTPETYHDTPNPIFSSCGFTQEDLTKWWNALILHSHTQTKREKMLQKTQLACVHLDEVLSELGFTEAEQMKMFQLVLGDVCFNDSDVTLMTRDVTLHWVLEAVNVLDEAYDEQTLTQKYNELVAAHEYVLAFEDY